LTGPERSGDSVSGPAKLEQARKDGDRRGEGRRKLAATQNEIRDDEALAILRDRPHGLTARELTDELANGDVQASKPTVLRALARLEARGEAHRVRQPDERRGGRRGPAPELWFAGELADDPPPRSWRMPAAELMAKLRTKQKNGYRPTEADAAAILKDLEQAGMLAMVDATGVAPTPFLVHEYGDAFRFVYPQTEAPS
jgi:hypothetical protein